MTEIACVNCEWSKWSGLNQMWNMKLCNFTCYTMIANIKRLKSCMQKVHISTGNTASYLH